MPENPNNPKLVALATCRHQHLHPGDQVVYASEASIRAHTLMGEITVTFSPGWLRVARIISIEEIIPPWAEADGDYKLILDNGDEVDAESVCRTDQDFV